MKINRLKWWELAALLAVVAVLSIIGLTTLLRMRETSLRMSCQNNLKQWGAILRMYANESKGLFPRCATKDERTNLPGHGFLATPYAASLYPNYLNDLSMYFCPSSNTELEDYIKCPGGQWCGTGNDEPDSRNFASRDYRYHGWLTSDDDYFATMVACALLVECSTTTNAPEVAEGDLNLDSFGGREAVQATLDATVLGEFAAEGIPLPTVTTVFSAPVVPRVKLGVERFLITVIHGGAGADIYQSQVPVMWEPFQASPRDCAHFPGGCNVLYMDGHVEFFRRYVEPPPPYRSTTGQMHVWTPKVPSTDACIALSRFID